MAGEKTDVPAEPEQRAERKVIVIGGGTLALVLLLGALLGHVVRLRSGDKVLAYREMWRDHYPPIWKDLALRRINKGDSVQSVLKKHGSAHRDHAGPYTCLAYFTRGLGQREVTLLAKDGKLIAARASRQGAQHLFFDSPEQRETFGQAYRRFRKQEQLERDAYTIHCAITGGQDVFLSDHVERREVPGPPPLQKQMMEQLKKIYGDRYIQSRHQTHEELAVEVSEVLYGDLEPGGILMFQETYRTVDSKGDVFLHFEDDWVLSRYGRSEPWKRIVGRSALDWYQSLTPEQTQELEDRRADK